MRAKVCGNAAAPGHFNYHCDNLMILYTTCQRKHYARDKKCLESLLNRPKNTDITIDVKSKEIIS